jgi:hypothetical protein
MTNKKCLREGLLALWSFFFLGACQSYSNNPAPMDQDASLSSSAGRRVASQGPVEASSRSTETKSEEPESQVDQSEPSTEDGLSLDEGAPSDRTLGMDKGAPTVEGSQGSVSKASTPRPESTKASTPRPESTKTATPRPESTKASTPRPESTKASTPRPESTKTATPRPESTKTATPRPESTKVEAAQDRACEVSLVLEREEGPNDGYFERKLRAKVKNLGTRSMAKFSVLALDFPNELKKKVKIAVKQEPLYTTGPGIYAPNSIWVLPKTSSFFREIRKGEETATWDIKLKALSAEPQCFRPNKAFLTGVRMDGETEQFKIDCSIEQEAEAKSEGSTSICKALPEPVVPVSEPGVPVATNTLSCSVTLNYLSLKEYRSRYVYAPRIPGTEYYAILEMDQKTCSSFYDRNRATRSRSRIKLNYNDKVKIGDCHGCHLAALSTDEKEISIEYFEKTETRSPASVASAYSDSSPEKKADGTCWVRLGHVPDKSPRALTWYQPKSVELVDPLNGGSGQCALSILYDFEKKMPVYW